MKNVVILAILLCSNAIFASVPRVINPIDKLVVFNGNSYDKHIDDEHEHSDELFCQCRCSVNVVIGSREVTLYTYVNNAQTCSNYTSGNGSFDASDCKNGGGMLNAQSVEEFKAAEGGGGC
jgi:hypothetical protein